MVVGVTLFIMAVLIIAIWVIIETKRLKHKVFAFFLIGIILFSYLSAAVIFRGDNIDFKTPSGLFNAGKIYFSWVFSVSGNFVKIAGNAIKMDWSTDSESEASVDKGMEKVSGYLD